MKTIPAPLLAHTAIVSKTLATALKITREDGAIYGFTSHDKSRTLSGVLYSSTPGLLASSIETSSGPAVGNLELTTLHDGTLFTDADILSGRWRNAKFYLFRYNWASATDEVEPLLAGTIADVELRRTMVVAELRDFRQYLQQATGDNSSKTCRARLGDTRCKKVLTSFTYTGALTFIQSRQIFVSAARTEADGWFNEGRITFLTGANAGITARIKESISDGTFTLALPLWADLAIGNTYSIIAGCQLRLVEDCHDKFNNVLNFQGEPHRAGVNSVTKAATA